MESSGNKRKHPRLKSPLIAKFRLHKDKDSSSAGNWDMVSISDISAGGLSFNYRDNIPVGTVLEFSLELSFSAANINCLAVVQRVDEKPTKRWIFRKNSLRDIAVKFVDMNSQQQQVIEKLVEEFNKNMDNKP